MPSKQQRILLFGALAATLATAGVLIFHTVRHATQVISTVKHARHTDEGEALRPWMTIPYIAASHRVPPKVLYDAIAFPAERHRPWPLTRIARRQTRPVEALIAQLENAIARAHGHAPPHPEGSPP
jgi:hypothetical protein